MIPALWKATGNDPGVNVINEVNVGIWYLAYVQQRVFQPAGVSGVTCSESNDATAALVYNAGNTAAGGKLLEVNPPDLDGCGGHANLHLSALDLAKFIAHLTTAAPRRRPAAADRLRPARVEQGIEHVRHRRHLLARRRRRIYEQQRHARGARLRDEVPGQHPGDHRRQLEHHLGPVPVHDPARRLQEGDSLDGDRFARTGEPCTGPFPRERGVSLEPLTPV